MIRNSHFLVSIIAVLCLIASCKKNENKDGCMDPYATNYDPEAVYDDGSCIYNSLIIVEGEITDTTIWYRGSEYLIRGNVYVRNGGQLRIDTGVVVYGEKATHGTLIVQQGGQILAEGTSDNPVVFTSDQEEGLQMPGDWGGIIVCGRAQVNYSGGTGTIEGIEGTEHGGTDHADNSGFLRYIRIEYAGYIATAGEERAGLMLAATGKGTVVDYIQVLYSGDDSFQWRGGSTSCGHLISFKAMDDDFDCNYGHHGVIQFAVALREPSATVAAGADGIEAETDDSGNDVQPHTLPVFTNVSLFGPLPTTTSGANQNYNSGLDFRNNTKFRIFNSIVCGFKQGLQISGASTENGANIGDLQVRNCVLAGCPLDFVTDQGSGFGLAAWYGLQTFNNEEYDEISSLQLNDPFNLSSPDFLPSGSSSLMSGADFSNVLLSNDPFIQQVNFRGAFGGEDWTKDWARW